MKSPARGGLTSAPQFLMFIDGCVELSWKWGVPKQSLKWEVVPDQPVEAEKPRLITNFFYKEGYCSTYSLYFFKVLGPVIQKG